MNLISLCIKINSLHLHSSFAMIIYVTFACIFYVSAHKNNDFFKDGDLKSSGQNYNGPAATEHDAEEINNLEETLTMTGKWDEFKEKLAEEQGQYNEEEVMPNWQQNAHKWANWLRKIKMEHKNGLDRKAFDSGHATTVEPRGIPSAGLEAYWGDQETERPKPQVRPHFMAASDMLKHAETRLEQLSRMVEPPSSSSNLATDKNQAGMQNAPGADQLQTNPEYDVPDYQNRVPRPPSEGRQQPGPPQQRMPSDLQRQMSGYASSGGQPQGQPYDMRRPPPQYQEQAMGHPSGGWLPIGHPPNEMGMSPQGYQQGMPNDEGQGPESYGIGMPNPNEPDYQQGMPDHESGMGEQQRPPSYEMGMLNQNMPPEYHGIPNYGSDMGQQQGLPTFGMGMPNQNMAPGEGLPEGGMEYMEEENSNTETGSPNAMGKQQLQGGMVMQSPPNGMEMQSPPGGMVQPPLGGMMMRPPQNGMKRQLPYGMGMNPPSGMGMQPPSGGILQSPQNGMERQSPYGMGMNPPSGMGMQAPSGEMMQPPQNGMERQPPYGMGMNLPSGMGMQPPSGGMMQSPQNGMDRQPPYGMGMNPNGMGMEPPSGGMMQPHQNGMERQPPYGMGMNLPSGMDMQPPSGGMMQPHQNGMERQPPYGMGMNLPSGMGMQPPPGGMMMQRPQNGMENSGEYQENPLTEEQNRQLEDVKMRPPPPKMRMQPPLKYQQGIPEPPPQGEYPEQQNNMKITLPPELKRELLRYRNVPKGAMPPPPRGPEQVVMRETGHRPLKVKKNGTNELPGFDDFLSPIKWVKFSSNETSDGLAQVTDPKTGKNWQVHINGTLYVPVSDYNPERLGLTTPKSTTSRVRVLQSNVLRTLTKNVDLKSIDESDWLAIETAMGGRTDEDECVGDTCQSRCHKMGCETRCSGDTCASGCIGASCSAFCKGPGCLAMCIGEECSAKCDGLNCDARCRGNGCESTCHSFSCLYTINGQFKKGGGNWEQNYPEHSAAHYSYE